MLPMVFDIPGPQKPRMRGHSLKPPLLQNKLLFLSNIVEALRDFQRHLRIRFLGLLRVCSSGPQQLSQNSFAEERTVCWGLTLEGKYVL